ncbi:C2 domain-containing protein [Cryptosporidium ubiquitum]|uniref:C2 domain-containing protein n=1 Tax=Cryptosporidium ubiquitum TaxID=857276 RepID=A0A1J4MEJ9_9CRYT|nr:C2 domain-containing protein [Cryptosporidium ubiquitum]OII71293.1 C2 domain-containing protein [Cryptosporidium ubiquitum]
MVKKRNKKKNKKEINKEVLKNAGFDEGEIWRLDFKEEIEFEENVVDQSRYEVPLFDLKGYRSQKKIGKPMGQDIEMEEEHDSDVSHEDSEVIDVVAQDDFEEYEIEQQKDDESRFLKKRFEIELDYMKKLRVWEASFFIHSSENLENTQQEFFYVIEFGHVNPERNYEGTLKRMMVYTAATLLKPGEVKLLTFPIIVWPKKILYISYSELEMFQISIKIWAIATFTFNQLLASVKLTLKDILENEPETYLMFKKHLPAPLGKDGKPRKDLNQKSFEVHRSRVTLQLQEIFDYDISLESWSFIPNRKLPIEIKKAPKFLRLKVPLNNDINSGMSSRETMVTPYSTGGYWKAVCKFVFTGTKIQLRNAYIIVEVLAYLKFGPSVIGAAMIPLASVESYPLVKTTIRRVTIDIYKIIAGEMIGNVFCYSRSTGQPNENIRSRPSQVASGAALVSQLNINERYLVFRLFNCDNLAAADGVTGTSDPVVKVSWDGIVNTSSVREKTRRPVYNQNLYFPVRILDQRELLVTSFRRKCLPIDLLCKGPVKIEVWNKNDTSSILLGSGEVNLNKMYTIGKEDFRCLAEGLIDRRSRRADGKPNFDQEADRGETEDNIFVNNTLFTVPYNTLVLNMNMSLKSKGFGKSVLKPSIHFEMFFIPPFPADVVVPAPPSSKAISNIWKQLGNRWNRDFHKWKGIYKQWFSSAPDKRNFNVLQRHPQTEEIFPLCSYISPIAVPNLISNEGSLLHWINNFMYITLESQIQPPGKIPEFTPPNLFLLSKKGSITDHVLMLCSCLLGIGFDAYVCKGTIENGTLEHTWVMTRHRFGHIQFWEVTSKQRYVLPCRYGIDQYYSMMNPFQQNVEVIPSVNNDNNDLEVPDDNLRVEMFEKEREYYNGLYLQQWFEWLKQTGQVKYVETHANENMGIDIWGEFLVPDIKIDPKEVDYENPVEEDINDIGNRKSDRAKFQKTSLDAIRKVITEYIKNIPIIPDKRFLTPELISYVPYSTIELVFNNRQVWGNLGNHHPALITYDLNNPYKWRTFCGSKPENIFQDLIIEPPLQGRAVEKLEESISVSVEENIVLNRLKLGKDTLFDRSSELGERISAYLTLLEFKLTLDPLYDPGPPDNHTAWSALKTKEMIIKEEKEMKERQEKEEKKKLKLKKKSNFEDMVVSKQVSPGTVGNYSGQDPQVDFFNANFYGNLENKPESNFNRNKTGDNLVPQCYTNMAINASYNSNNPNAVGRDFKSEFPSLQYDPNSPYATSNFNNQNLNTSNVESNKQFVNNPVNNSANPNKMDSYHSFFQKSNSIEKDENKTKALTQSLKEESKFNVSNIPPNVHSEAHVISKSKINENNNTFFLEEVSSKNKDPKVDFKQNMENEIIDFEEKKLSEEKNDEDLENLENDVKYWNALVDSEIADSLEIEPELPEEGVNLSKIGMKAKISNWAKPEKEKSQIDKDSQKENVSENQSESKTAKEEKSDELINTSQVNSGSEDESEEEEEIQPPPWRKLNRPLKYINDQISKWNWYYRMEQLYYDWQAINFPTFPMSTFTGFPIHFSTADPNDVRSFIVGSKRFRIFIELPQDEAHFFIYPKIFPLVGGVSSTWVFLGVHIPWTNINELESRMKKDKRKNYFKVYSSNNSNISPTRDFETFFKYQNFQEFNKNIPNLGEINLLTENFQANKIYEKNDFEQRFKAKEKNFANRDRRFRTNELHKFSKYWLKKLGIPKELPPSAWCNEEGVIMGIPITNNFSKILNEKIKSISGRQLPVITEDFLDRFFEQNHSDQLYSKGLNVACNGKAVISNSFYEISGKFRREQWFYEIKLTIVLL